MKPSPFASLVCSLTIILSITSISLILKWCYNKWRAGRPINNQGRGDYVLGRLKEIDRTAVRWGSYLVGTHYRTPWRRVLGVLTFLRLPSLVEFFFHGGGVFGLCARDLLEFF